MIRLRSNRRRGNFIFGLAAITLFLGVLCGLVLTRSLEVYRDSAMLGQRLQCRAGAESLALLMERSPDAGTLTLGQNLVTVSSSSKEKDREIVSMRSTILSPRAIEIISFPSVAEYSIDAAGSRHLEVVHQP